ncbi:MAG TPA: hypothetical protein VFH73_25965 [Polyangia bacterium]|jgi:hypothetical protein|nr:hypothetical protein [Polyangia bacterium]
MTDLGALIARFLGVAVLAAVPAGCGRSLPETSNDAGRSLPETSDDAAPADAGVCGAHGTFGPKLSVSTVGPRAGRYEGPALVERSTATELVLTFQPAGGGTANALPMHAKITELSPMPRLPIGAKVWLSKVPAGEAVSRGTFPFPPLPPWSISVRERQGGRLLFGAAHNPSNEVPSPIALGAVKPYCTTASPDMCLQGVSVTYATVDVTGDRTVAVHDSETSIVPIGGFDYDVRVTAQELTFSADAAPCLDYSPSTGVSVDVRARDLGTLIKTLEVSAPPACSEGNADFEGAIFEIANVNFNTGYVGPAVYSHRVDNYFLFSVTGLTSLTGSPPMLQILAAGLLKEPCAGEEFWASLTFGKWGSVAALRGPQRGPLLLASVAFARAPFDATTASALAQALGVAADAQEHCPYASSDSPYASNGVLSLWDVVFQTTPPVRVASQSAGMVPIAGRDYNAWVSGEGNLVSFTLQAR